MGKFGRRVVQMQVQVLVDVCVHNGINVGELVGAERSTDIPLRFLKYIVHTLVLLNFSTSLSIQKFACSLEPPGTKRRLRYLSCSGSRSIIIITNMLILIKIIIIIIIIMINIHNKCDDDTVNYHNLIGQLNK